MPLTLGHENAGTVSAIGQGVHAVKEGDHVAVYGGWGDGFCDYCTAGEENVCPTMQWVGLSQHDGGYAEYLLVPRERYLVKLNTLAPRAAAPRTALNIVKPEVSVSVSWWGNIRELREVLALAESGRLTPIPLEFWPLAKINDVYKRVKHGQVAGRAVITP
jgi:D-arabinose 1-dehydrogenase-like Zn-dependent alcohol dehydrogenase